MKKLIALFTAAAICVLCLAGCGGPASVGTTAGGSAPGTSQAVQGSQAPTQEPSSVPTQPASDAEPVEIVLWHTLTDHHQAALNKIIDGFNASQSAYVVVAEQQPYAEYDAKLLQAVSTGSGPDFVTMFPSNAINYIGEGYLYDMAPFISDPATGIPDFSEQIPAGLNAEIRQWGGDSIYLFPTTFGSEVLYYNKTMFDELGLSEPKTWTELTECAKAIHGAYGIAGFGTDSITDSFQGWMMQAGSDYIDVENNRVALDRDTAIEKLNWFAEGCRQGYFRLVGEDYFFSNPFGSKAVGMYIGAAAGIGYVYAAVPKEGEGAFEVGCCPIPQEGPREYISSWGSTYVCLSRDEQHARGVYEYLKYMSRKESLVDWAIAFGALPARRESIEDPKFREYAQTNIAVMALSAEYDRIGYLPSVPGAAAVRTEIDKMVQSVALGMSDAETAFDDFVRAADAALADH